MTSPPNHMAAEAGQDRAHTRGVKPASEGITNRALLYLYRRFLYRRLMKITHRFNWHYAPPNHALTNDGGWPMHWCQWCGMRDFVMDMRAFRASEGLLAGGEQVRAAEASEHKSRRALDAEGEGK